MNKKIEAKSVLLAASIGLASLSTYAQPQSSAQPQSPFPMDQLGAVAGKQYQGDGLSINATPTGASLRCVFQRLEGEATGEGLWLSSTADGAEDERFRVMAVTRPTMLLPNLPPSGFVNVMDNVTRFTRPGLTEEYSVSMDGVRQDFILQQRPAGQGELRVELDVTGATAESLPNGARLTLIGSGRKLAYSRLHVTDAHGSELTARIEVTSENRLAVLVDDVSAVYPVRIDPTFSDENWVNIGGLRGADNVVGTAVVDGGGNLYIGGEFTVVGDVLANRIAKWDGSSWSALGSGMDGAVFELAVSGSDLYAGGLFAAAGGKVSGYAARANLGGNLSPGQFGSVVFSPVTGFSFTFSGGTVGQSYRIQTSPSLATGPWNEFTNFNYTVPIVFTDPSAGSGTNKFFRAVTP